MSWILLIFLSWFLLISLWLKFRKEPLPPIDNFSPVRSWFTYQGKTFEGARAYRELAEMLSQRIRFSRAVLEWGSLVRLFRAQLLWRSETHTHTHTHKCGPITHTLPWFVSLTRTSEIRKHKLKLVHFPPPPIISPLMEKPGHPETLGPVVTCMTSTRPP